MSQIQFILPSKRRMDVVTVRAFFDQLLLPGEEIVSGALNIYNFTGEDPTPEDMLDGAIFIFPTRVEHRIKQGISGNIYQLIFTATTDADNTYQVECRQAIVPLDMPVGPVYQQFYFTSRPYPLESVEGILSGLIPQEGTWIQIPIDGILSALIPISGILRDLVITYSDWPPEGITNEFEPIEGSLRDLILSYVIPPEGILSAFVPLVGILDNIVIIYSNYPPEGILSSFEPIAGSLV